MRRVRIGLALIIALLTVGRSLAQHYTLSGYVSDIESGEKIVGASISVAALKVGAITNEYGYYTITLDADSLSIDFITMGYERRSIKILIKKNTRLDVELKFSNVLQEVTVTPDDEMDIVSSTQMSTHRISGQVIRKTTMLLGESDVLKTLQLLPGVKGGNEGFAGIYVRGGTPDQNLILLDGAPVYNVNHLFGFLSTFNSDPIKDVVLYKGGIPARYGNRLSSVLDISLRDGNAKVTQGTFSISPIAGRLTVEGPVKKNVSSYIISLRRAWLDAFSTILFTDNQKTAYSFYDFNFKYNHSINRNNKITFGIYTGRDRFYSKFKSGNETSSYAFHWGNAAYTLRWNTIISPNLFATFLAYQSNYNFTQESKTMSNLSGQYRAVKSKIIDRSAQIDFDYDISSKSKIRFGSKLSFLGFSPEILQIADANVDTVINKNFQEQSLNSEFYIEEDAKLTSKLFLNAGIREAIYFTKNKNYSIVQPRFSVTYLLNVRTSIKASFNKMGQFLHLLTNSSLGFPTDLWVPSTDKTAPEKSIQYALGMSHKIPDKNLEASVEVYYKTMSNLLEYKDGANYLFGSKKWEDKVIYGSGSSYGAEFFINKKKGIITGWIGYTLAYTDRKFMEINDGQRFPFKYDRRHDLSVYANYNLNSRKSFSMVFVLASGNLATIPVNSYQGVLPPNYNLTPRYQSGAYTNDFVNQELVGNRNNYRLPLYHRLDVNYQTSKTTKRNNTRTWIFSIYNVYGRLNPFFLYESEGHLKKLALFPIIPSISYKLDF